MKFIFKETTLTDGSKVHDIQLVANGRSLTLKNHESVCIFSCTSERDALSFLSGLEELIEKHTLESLEEA